MPDNPVSSERGNIWADLSSSYPDEIIEMILKNESFRLERIVSTGQATPLGEWYDQDEEEWVLLLTGGARLLFEHKTEAYNMQPGDYLHIPAHCRHRVEWTDPRQPTVWLALHYPNRAKKDT